MSLHPDDHRDRPRPGVDFTDTSLFASGPPYDVFERLRRESPLTWSDAPSHWPVDEGRGWWNLVRAQDIADVIRDAETFSSWQGGITIPSSAVGSLESVRAMMIGKDPPEHTRQRKVVTSAFTPKRVADLETSIRANVTRAIDAVIHQGQCDFVESIAGPLPMNMVADLLGVPAADRPHLFRWTDAIFGFNDPAAQAELSVIEALAQATDYMVQLDRERQRCPADDLVSTIARAEVDGDRLAVDQRAGLFIQLFAAGVDTTRSTLALGMEALIRHPEQRRRLLEDPSLIARGVEEINRWTSVVMYMRRTATRDVEIGNQQIRAGEAVVCWHASANRDPDAIADPARFDVARTHCPHQAFGGAGRHFCLGAGLARLELQVAFSELLRRMPDLVLDGPLERSPANWLQSVRRMPVRFSPAAPGR